MNEKRGFHLVLLIAHVALSVDSSDSLVGHSFEGELNVSKLAAAIYFYGGV